MIYQLSLVLFFSCLISIGLIPICRYVAKKYGIIDKPNERKIHKDAVPYLGGAAIFAGFVLGLIYITFGLNLLETDTFLVLLIASSSITLLGLIDDIRGANAPLKLSVQLVVAIFIVSQGIYVSEITNPFGGGTIQLYTWGKVISVLWIVAISNAINLLDGLDGLAGGVSAIAICFMLGFSIYLQDYSLAGLLVGLLGGILGFLLFNFPPASVFMGDMGSLLIGFLFSVFCLKAGTKGPYTITVLAPAMLMTLPIFDAILAIVRRARRGSSIFNADKEHLHHRILAISNSYKRTLFFIYLVNIFIGLIAMVAFLIPNEYRILMIFILAENLFLGLLILKLIEDRKLLREKLDAKN